MKPVDSKKKMLDLTDIILMANYNKPNSRDPNEALALAIAEMSMPITKHMRVGNTLFVINKGRGRNGYMAAMNVDTPRNFVENVRKFLVSAYLLGFDNLVTVFDEPAYLQIFHILAKNPPREDMAYEIRENKNGQYVAGIKLGPPREEVMQ